MLNHKNEIKRYFPNSYYFILNNNCTKYKYKTARQFKHKTNVTTIHFFFAYITKAVHFII